MSTLVGKIARAALDVGGRLKADRTNTQDRYDYVSADKILAECGQALAKEGVVIVPTMTNAEIALGQTASGKNRYDARVEFIMTVSDGETVIPNHWYGFGADYTTPDKAIYKAITSGHKYFISKLLMVGEGNEDGEHEITSPTEKAPGNSAKGAQASRSSDRSNGHASPATPPAPAMEIPQEVAHWEKPDDAYEWAVGIGASDNVHAARNAMKRIVEAHGGRFTAANAEAIYVAYYHERMARAREKAVAALEAIAADFESVPEQDPDGVFA